MCLRQLKAAMKLQLPILNCCCHFSLSPQWLPYNWCQLVYIVLRWIVALYFLAWLIYVFAAVQEPKLLIFLTIWGFITWVLYLLVAALSSTVKMVFWIQKTLRGRRESDLNPADHLHSIVVTWSEDRVAWYQKIHWVLFVMAIPLQICIMVLYWTLLSSLDPNRESADNYNLHLLGGLVGLVDIFASGIVLSIYHLYWGVVYACVYSAFTGIYYAADGTNINGRPYIYPILDYGRNPGTSAGIVLATSLVVMPLIYVLVYAIIAGRRWLAHRYQLWLYRCLHSSFERDSEAETHPVPLEEESSFNV